MKISKWWQFKLNKQERCKEEVIYRLHTKIERFIVSLWYILFLTPFVQSSTYVISYYILHILPLLIRTLPEITLILPFLLKLSFPEILWKMSTHSSFDSFIEMQSIFRIGFSFGRIIIFCWYLYLMFYFSNSPIAFKILTIFISWKT